MTLLGYILPALLGASPGGAGTGAPALADELRLSEVSLRPSARDDHGVDAAAQAWRVSAWLAASDAPDGSGGGDAPKQAPPGDRGQAPPPAPGTSPAPGSLEFDLLGPPPRVGQVDERALRLRRTLLTWHQGAGLGMFALQLATTVVGQLNYDDKFGGDNTGKYVQPHAILAYSTLAAFVAAGTLALLAPAPPVKRDEGFDRVSLHKVAMIAAAVGMLAEGVLGIWTKSREGYLNQQSIGTVHLVIGYATFAAVATGVGAIVF